MRVKWSKLLETGYKNVDDQHKELFNRLESFFDAVDNGSGKQEILRTLDYFEDYVITHCREEEEIQKEINYPEFYTHSMQHELFKNQLSDIRYICDHYGISSAVVSSFERKLLDYWDYHINKLDKELADYLRKDIMKENIV